MVEETWWITSMLQSTKKIIISTQITLKQYVTFFHSECDVIKTTIVHCHLNFYVIV